MGSCKGKSLTAGGPACVKQEKDQIMVPTFLSPACFNQTKTVYFLVCYLWP